MRQSRGAAECLAGGVILGTAGTAAAFAPTAATAPGLGGLRLIVGSLVLVTILPWVSGTWRNIPRLLRRPTVWVMAVGAAAFQPLFFGAMDRAGVAVGTLLAVGSVPIFAGLVGWVTLGHRPTPAWGVATLVAVVGLGLLSLGQDGVGDDVGPGVLMALTAAFGFGCYLVAAKTELDRGAHIAELPAAAYLLGSVFLIPMVASQPLGWLLAPAGAGVALYLGAITMALGNILPISGMRQLHAGPASTLLLAEPLTATVLGVLVLTEPVSAPGMVGIALVFAGLILQTRALSTPSPASGRAPQVQR